MASTNVNVRLSGKLMEHLEKQISDDGLFENASEYVRDLIRHDLQEQEKPGTGFATTLSQRS